MNSRKISLKALLCGVLILTLVVLAYLAINFSAGYLADERPALFYGLMVGCGIVIAALGLLIACAGISRSPWPACC
jgi:hypothetical protein